MTVVTFVTVIPLPIPFQPGAHIRQLRQTVAYRVAGASRDDVASNSNQLSPDGIAIVQRTNGPTHYTLWPSLTTITEISASTKPIPPI